jgi:hypothetical protein
MTEVTALSNDFPDIKMTVFVEHIKCISSLPHLINDYASTPKDLQIRTSFGTTISQR